MTPDLPGYYVQVGIVGISADRWTWLSASKHAAGQIQPAIYDQTSVYGARRLQCSIGHG